MKKKIGSILVIMMSISLCFGCGNDSDNKEKTSESIVSSVQDKTTNVSQETSTTKGQETSTQQTIIEVQITTQQQTTTEVQTTTQQQTTTEVQTTTQQQTTTEVQTTTQQETTTSLNTSYPVIGNKNSKAYHRTSCSRLPNEQNRIYFNSEEEANAAGYDNPCAYCNP